MGEQSMIIWKIGFTLDFRIISLIHRLGVPLRWFKIWKSNMPANLTSFSKQFLSVHPYIESMPSGLNFLFDLA